MGDVIRNPPAPYPAFYNCYSFELKMNLEDIWLTLTSLHNLFLLEKMNESDTEYCVKLVFTLNGKSKVKF